MLSTRHWVYLDLEKTGCTFLRKALQSLYPANVFVEADKHSLMENECSLPKILTIRDPYLYYFSLWSYGITGRGGFRAYLQNKMPGLAYEIYSNKQPANFCRFLDYVLNSPVRYPNHLRCDWLPFGFDLYTTRILSMIIPVSLRGRFIFSLGADCINPEKVIECALPFVPEILIRTETLNSDFHALADNGALGFMELPLGWKQVFPLDSPRINASNPDSQNKASSPFDFWLSGWKDLVKEKSALSLWMLNLASSRLLE